MMFSIANSVSYSDCVKYNICNLYTFNSEFYYRVIENKTIHNNTIHNNTIHNNTIHNDKCYINEEYYNNTNFILYEEENRLEISNYQIKKCLSKEDIYNMLIIMNIMACE